MAAESKWIRTADELPPERVVLRMSDSGGNVQRLQRVGNLYWFDDMSMYVYFTPVSWESPP